MIHTKIVGFSLLILLLFASCSVSNSIKRQSHFVQESYSYYLNDTLQFAYRFAGDYQYKNSIQDKSFRFTFPKNCAIAHFQTHTSPNFAHVIYHCSNTDSTKIEKKLKRLLFEKQDDYYINEQQAAVGKYFKLTDNKGYILMLAVSHPDTFASLKREYHEIFSHVFVGKKYKSIVDISSPFDLGRKREFCSDSSINYLLPVYLLKRRAQNYTLSLSDRSLWLQAVASFMSRITSKMDETISINNEWRGEQYVKKQTINPTQILNSNAETVQALVNQCRKNQVVMLNENHFTIQHRMLLYLLLDTLYQAGYSYLALEALWENDTILNQRGFAVASSGFYIREPLLGVIIRKAIQLGYKVIGYDDFSADRENRQAQNIYQKTVAQDSTGKVLILAGFAHIDEKHNKMAQEFHRISKINPLTINQTDYFINDRQLCQIDTATLQNKRLSCDIWLANNIDYMWWAHYVEFRNYTLKIPDTLFAKSTVEAYQYIINIYQSDEYKKDKTAIPVYTCLIEAPQQQLSIGLPADNYIFVIKNRYGDILENVESDEK